MASRDEPEAPEAVLEALHAEVNESIVTFTLLNAGIQQYATFLRLLPPPSPGNPDPEWLIGRGDPNSLSARVHAVTRHSRVIELVAQGGPLAVRVGHQWAISLYAQREERFRARLARAHRCAREEVTEPFFGDLRLLRKRHCSQRWYRTA